MTTMELSAAENEHIKEGKKPDIELLGQKINFPRTWQGDAVVLVLAVLIIWVTFIALVQSRPENLQTLGLITGQLQINTRQQKVEQRKWFRFEFWTPSERTAQGLTKYLSKHQDKMDEYRWQMHDEKSNNIGQKNDSFGRRLIEDSAIEGYRKFPVYGNGKSCYKEGWWWIVGVKGEYSDNFFQWFAEAYKEHWGMPGKASSYVEVTALSPSK